MKKITWPLLVAAGIMVASGCSTSNSSFNAPPEPPSAPETVSDSILDPSSASQEEAVLLPYSQAEFNSMKGTEAFALYFSADWCPSCRATKKAIAQNPSAFEGVRLLDVDYDTQTDLKQEYGITMQHSFVFFNKEGELSQTLVAPKDKDVILWFNG